MFTFFFYLQNKNSVYHLTENNVYIDWKPFQIISEPNKRV